MSLEMDPEIRAQWCAALRSGEYKQATQNLRITDEDNGDLVGHCCLGVLTDLYIKDGQPLEVEIDGWTTDVWDYDGVLAPPVREWAGLNERNPLLTVALKASELNDGGSPFAEIADLIDGGTS